MCANVLDPCWVGLVGGLSQGCLWLDRQGCVAYLYCFAVSPSHLPCLFAHERMLDAMGALPTMSMNAPMVMLMNFKTHNFSSVSDCVLAVQKG